MERSSADLALRAHEKKRDYRLALRSLRRDATTASLYVRSAGLAVHGTLVGGRTRDARS